MKRIRVFAVALFLCVARFSSFCQCTAPPGAASNNCTTPGSIQLTSDNTNINTGQEYFFTGSGTINSVNINGGILRICGNLSLTNLNFNNGSIIVEPSGSLNYAGSAATVTSSNQEITNYGTLMMTQNYQLNNNSFLVNHGTLDMSLTDFLTATPLIIGSPDAFLVNEPSGLFNLPTLNANINSAFINRGTSQFGNLTINSQGSVCMGAGSVIITNNITNNPANSISVESGMACISYNGQAVMNNQLSNTSSLFVCRLAGSQNPAPSSFGSATVLNPCTSCQVALPVSLVSFTGSPIDNGYLLQWTTASEDNVQSFIIESSEDGTNFQPLGEVNANNRPSSYTFDASIQTKTFFRLKMVDIGGSFKYSAILLAMPSIKSNQLIISPNPVESDHVDLIFTLLSDVNGQLSMTDMTGQVVKQQSLQLKEGSSSIRWSLNIVPAGIYLLSFRNERVQIETEKLVKVR